MHKGANDLNEYPNFSKTDVNCSFIEVNVHK